MFYLWYVQGAVGQELHVFALRQAHSVLQPPDGDRRLPVSLTVQDGAALWRGRHIAGLCDEGQLAEG